MNPPFEPLPGAKVSVIVPARNEARRIPECLRSLLAQTYEPLEIIVVDDGSRDGTPDVAASFAGVRVLRRAHAGHGASLNAGADVSSGAILCFLDSDMVFAPDFVARLVAPIIAGAVVGTAHGIELVANADNPWSRCWQQHAGLPLDRRIVLTPAKIAEGSTTFRAIRADAWRKAGGLDDIGYHDDQTLWPKVGRRATWVPEASCRHYNVETLGEVAALGRWGAQDVYATWGRRALGSYSPPVAWPRALAEAWRHHSLAMVPYLLAYSWGMWRGLAERARRAG